MLEVKSTSCCGLTVLDAKGLAWLISQKAELWESYRLLLICSSRLYHLVNKNSPK